MHQLEKTERKAFHFDATASSNNVLWSISTVHGINAIELSIDNTRQIILLASEKQNGKNVYHTEFHGDGKPSVFSFVRPTTLT